MREAKIMRLPVMWALNSPPSPRKLIASTLPAVKLRITVRNFIVQSVMPATAC
jgi:hypothetical protein